MVSKVEKAPGCWQFVLRPNCSASPRQIRLFFVAIAATSLTVAIAFTLAGFWPVLPFAGAELLALWLALQLSAARARETEVIRIEADTVEVERGRTAPQCRWTFQRAWARISLEPALHRLHPSRLVLGSHGRRVRVGAFLTETERSVLARDLSAAIAPPA
jgi:uncharacterized membrane protein